MSMALLKADVTGVGLDDATTFRAYVKSKALPPAGVASKLGAVREGFAIARSATAVSISVSATRDFGEAIVSSTILLTPGATETRVIKDLQELQNADLTHAQITVGDLIAVSSQWTVDLVWVQVHEEGEK